ncbi:MAG: hypothetical protein ACKOTD_00290 [Phycisphaerales bacterium]
MSRAAAFIASIALCTAAGCSGVPAARDGVATAAASADATARAAALQSVVMSMADEWNAALGEAAAGLVSGPSATLQERWLAQAMLRNGFGASLDIAVGANPAVSMLDMLVLASLQEWTIRVNWAGHGIPREAGLRAAERLSRTRDDLWATAASHMPRADLDRLRALVAAWIERHPDRVLVAFIRLSDFAGERNQLTLAERRDAGGLLQQLDSVTEAVDGARLLGERALWYAARYPYAVGQQAEFTGYRLADSLASEFRAERAAIFEAIADERAAIVQAIEEEARTLRPTLAEARGTIEEARALSSELLKVVTAVDGLVARFDTDGSGGGLTADDLDRLLTRSAAAAAEARGLIEASARLVDDERISGGAAAAGDYVTDLVDRAALWALGIVAALIAGLALLRRR